MSPLPHRGLYAIVDLATVPAESATATTRALLAGGATAIQLRAKPPLAANFGELAIDMLRLCRQRDVPLIINDYVELARDIGADGVHIGSEDCALAVVKKKLGDEIIVGVSCYNSLERAERAAAEGASYVAFGSLFPSATKPKAVAAPLTLLAEAKRRLSVPIAAIGGISLANAGQVIDAGADLLAVISALYETQQPETVARAFANLFETSRD